MIDLIYNFVLTNNIFFYCLISCLITFFSIFLSQKLSLSKFSENLENVQAIHIAPTPRLGGLCILLSMCFFYFFQSGKNIYINDENLFNNILLFGGLITLTTLVEDIFNNTSPRYRLICIAIPTILFFYFSDIIYPVIEIPFFSSLFEVPLFALIFYSFAVIAISNGFNLIDGVNGLSCVSAFCAFSCLLFLSVRANDELLAYISCIFLIFLIVFILFNFPYGKIFLGDSGAYFLGFCISTLLIVFFGRNNDFSPWNAILILFYPAFETIFSFFRKIFFEKKSPFLPDPHHLHLKIFFLMKDSNLIKRKRFNNSLVLPFLSIVWSSPLLLMPWVYEHSILIIIFFCILCLGYIGFYAAIPRTLKEKY